MARALILFPGALGDFVCFLPALAKIARNRRVDLFARSEYEGILCEQIRVRSLERHEISRLFAPECEGDERLCNFFSGYDSVYSWMGTRQQAFVQSLYRVCRGDLRCFAFQPQASTHTADYYLSCIGEVSASQDWRWVLRPNPDALTWARSYVRERGWEQRKLLILGPGSGAKEKNWPVAAYHEIARAWERKAGNVAIMVIGPAEEENQEIRRELATGPCVVRGLDLAKTTALLCQCHGYIGNDSGLTHLAAALGRRTLAIFGPTDPVRWSPRGADARVLSLAVECSPCDLRSMKSCAHRRCLTGLSTDEVLLNLSREFGRGEACAP
jgi:ADP-heptose:LPS heptosyltransferase